MRGITLFQDLLCCSSNQDCVLLAEGWTQTLMENPETALTRMANRCLTNEQKEFNGGRNLFNNWC